MEDSNHINDLPTINRYALVLVPTESYLEWTRSCPEPDPELTLEDLYADCTAYLIPEMEAGFEAWFKQNYLPMFEHELDSWCTDDTLWPEDRSFEQFQKFFEVMFHSTVLDTSDEPIGRYTL